MDRLVATRVSTERLALEPLQVEHAEEMVSVLADPSLYAFTGGEPPSLEALRDRYRSQVASSGRADEWWGNWVVRRTADREALGFVQATVMAEVADLAWVIGVDHQGQGYAGEAGRGLTAWLVEHGVHRCTAHIAPDHQRSAAVAIGAGFIESGVFDDDGEQIWVRPNQGHAPVTAVEIVSTFLGLSAVESTYSGPINVDVETSLRRVTITDDGRGMQLAPDPGDAVAHAERVLTSPYPIEASDPYVEATLRRLVWGDEGCQGPYRANRSARALRFRSHRDGEEWSQAFAFGVRLGPPERVGPTTLQGTSIELLFDEAPSVGELRAIADQLQQAVPGFRVRVIERLLDEEESPRS